VLSRVDYLASLNVDAVWFSPFYPSALADGGYDVDDYRDVDPSIGTLADFEAVIAALHGRGIKVIIDIVPNHSSNRHAWFREALASPAGSPARDRYLFRDGKGPGGELPPNDWQAMFGGSAWTRIAEPDGTPGQWYFHMFAPQQPDWNWDNPEVREDFLATLRFWGDRGVDGFRVDVASGLAKDMSEPYPEWERVMHGPMSFLESAEVTFDPGRHPLFDRDELDEIYAGWRQVFNTYDPPLFAVAEAWVTPDRQARYASTDGLGQSFNFDLLSAGWDIGDFRTVIQRNLEFAEANDTTSTWVFSNHDVIRHATRYSQSSGYRPMFDRMTRPDDAAAARGLARARAATLLALALPGSAYLYQGEELGLPEVFDIPADRAQDPSAVIENGVIVAGRDGCRVPLPWTASGEFFGFSDGGAHLPQPKWYGAFSVEAESDDPNSTLTLYREALRLRRKFHTSEHLEWLDLGNNVLAFTRPNGWISVTNFGATPAQLPVGTVVVRTDGRHDRAPLAPDSTAWLVRG
jgi:alpha-glucosidase